MRNSATYVRKAPEESSRAVVERVLALSKEADSRWEDANDGDTDRYGSIPEELEHRGAMFCPGQPQ
jgi:hypothetical protein